MSHKILVAQGGGPTAVINQSLVGAALEARRFPSITNVYGAIHGVRGIIDEDLVDLSRETIVNLEAIAVTPAAALGSTRDKPDRKYCQEIFRVMRAHEIDTFLLHRRQRFLRHGENRRRTGARGRQPDPRHSYPEDHRQRPRRLRPHAGLPIRGALRHPSLHGRQPRQRRVAGRLCRSRHGPPRRLPHRRLGAGAQIPRRRPASDLLA